ncbi:uncharacterized protein LOC131612840 [Vicia villosa]|uniref:uncharacterized protein LOC131612840 n=1 Tax=Vicia villosa TaxID=3911 RepID=UPI00273C6BDC|nr:uncharacterized protein LOC131612840 [Vicia villosa]
MVALAFSPLWWSRPSLLRAASFPSVVFSSLHNTNGKVSLSSVSATTGATTTNKEQVSCGFSSHPTHLFGGCFSLFGYSFSLAARNYSSSTEAAMGLGCCQLVLKVFDDRSQRSSDDGTVFFRKNLFRAGANQSPFSIQHLIHPQIVSFFNIVNRYNRLARDKASVKAKDMILNLIDIKIVVPKLICILRKSYVWWIGLRNWFGNSFLGSFFAKFVEVHSLFGSIISVVVKLWKGNTLTKSLSLCLYLSFFIY